MSQFSGNSHKVTLLFTHLKIFKLGDVIYERAQF